MRRLALTVVVLVSIGAGSSAAEVVLRQHILDEPWSNGVIQAADLDGDKDCDLVVVLDGGLSWIENIGSGKKFAEHQIEATTSPPNVAVPADLDGDGDLDLVTQARLWGGNIDWSENPGKGKSWHKHEILGGDIGDDVKALALADADGDHDLDLVIAGRGAQWLVNQDGSAKKWSSPSDVAGITSDILTIAVGDFDGDGDNDLVASDKDSREFVYAQNGGDSWISRRVVQKVDHPMFLPTSARVLDFDNDGDLDVFAVPLSNQVVLYENQDGQGNFVSKVLAKIDRLVMATPVDLDGDGDIDIVAACQRKGDGVIWIENEHGSFEKRHQISQAWERPTLLEAVDFDGDGDRDIISVSNDIDGTRTAWWENQGQ